MSVGIMPRTLDGLEEPIWEQQRQIGEKDTDYAMYLVFSALKPSCRTLRNAWLEWVRGTPREGGPMAQTFSRAAATYRWAERAAAYDIHVLKGRLEVWSDRDWEWRDKDYRSAADVRDKIDDAISRISFETTDSEGNTKVDSGAILNALKLVSELQKAAIPQGYSLSAIQIQDALNSLPIDKREAVISIMSQRQKMLGNKAPEPELLPAPKRKSSRPVSKRTTQQVTIEGEYSRVEDDE